MSYDLIIRFPTVSESTIQVASGLSVQFDHALSDLHDALTLEEVRNERVRDFTIKVTNWVHTLEDSMLEARTALAIWIDTTDALHNVIPTDLTEGVRLDQTRDYFAKDTAVRLSLVVELLFQLANEVYSLGYPDRDKFLRSHIFSDIGNEPAVKELKGLVDDPGCKLVQDDLRNAYVHRANPTRGKMKWIQDGTTTYLTSGEARIRISEALPLCRSLYDLLSQKGSAVLGLIEERVPTLVRIALEKAKI